MENGKKFSKSVTYIDNKTGKPIFSFGGTIFNIPLRGDIVIFEDKVYKVVKKIFSYASIDDQVFTKIGVLVENYKKNGK